MEPIEIGAPGIKKALEKFKAESAICEYIWNGLDAEAKNIEISFESNEIGFLNELRITDDGTGIAFPLLKKKFKPFLQTDKTIDPTAIRHGPSATHGKKGIGRLTFFKFAHLAEWTTVYKAANGRHYKYTIKVDSDTLNNYDYVQEVEVTESTGTTVCFHNFITLTCDHIEVIAEYLAKEFAWYLELATPFKRTISINGSPLTYEYLIGEREEKQILLKENTFDIRFVRWEESLHDEFSRFYFIGSDNHEKKKKHTSFNKKGDGFFHSLYIQSAFFDNFNDILGVPDTPATDKTPEQLTLANIYSEQSEVYSELIKKLEEYIKQKRKPFLRKKAVQFVQEMDQDGLLPPISSEPWDQMQLQALKEILEGIYEIDSRIFRHLSKQQKSTLARLFYLIMNSTERDNLLDVLEQVVELDQKERAELANILRTTQLSNVIATIKLIEDRFVAVDELKKIVFNSSFGANERDNLQTHIERHYWLFGEQYHLVTSAEPDFEEALRRYVYILQGENKPRKINHPDKNKEMDIFAVCQIPNSQQLHHVVVELKHPRIKLGSKELNQVKTYMQIILEQPEFNGQNREWDFYLVGNGYDDYIRGEFENAKSHGLRNLVYMRGNYRIFVMSWDDVITNFQLKHEFLYEKLKIEREKLASKEETADDIIINGASNTAIEPPVVFPQKNNGKEHKKQNLKDPI